MIELLLNNLKQRLIEIVNGLKEGLTFDIVFEIPKDKANGDYSCNIAMRLARELRKSPRDIANMIISEIDKETFHLNKIEVAGAGFINLYLDKSYLSEVVFKVISEGSNYGKLPQTNEKYLIEFVSANPKGYLHVGHGRGAAYGDSLARIMR